MLTTSEPADDEHHQRPAWSTPRLQRLPGQHVVAAGVDGGSDGEVSETGFS